MAMSALAPISSALPPEADVLEACARLPVLTQSGHYAIRAIVASRGLRAQTYGCQWAIFTPLRWPRFAPP
ncbi:MAG: hypothetical protein O7B24_07630, partial [Alphaproteobacteria bacterium]|nr:hypothetical protein [Alphaproteobacteria bacterium]